MGDINEKPIKLKLNLSLKKSVKKSPIKESLIKLEKKIDNNDNKINKKLADINEEIDARIDIIKNKLQKEEKLSSRQQKLVSETQRILKNVNEKTKLSAIFERISNRLDFDLSSSDKLFIRVYISHFNNRDKYGLSCIDGSNLQVKDYQARVIKHMLNNRGLLVFHNMGSGKTLSAVIATQCALQQAIRNGEDMEIVVVTPTSLQRNFHKELEAYGVSAKSVRYHYFTFRSFYLRFKDDTDKELKKYFKNKFMVIDEAHTLKYKADPNEEKSAFRRSTLERMKTVAPKESKVNKVFLKASLYVKKILLMSGTPILNRPSDVINLIAMIDGTKPVSLDFFESKIYGRENPEQKEQSIRNRDEFDKYFKCKISFYQTTDIENYPTMNEKFPKLRMSKDFYRQYMKIEMSNDITVFYNDIRQAINNIDGAKNPKVEFAIKKISQGEQTVVYSNYKFTRAKAGKKKVAIDHIIDYMEEHKIKYTSITGDNSKAQREKSVNKYNKGEVQVFLITSAGSLGIDLKNTRNVILMEPFWNREFIKQIIGRAVRYLSHAKLPKEERYVNVYHLLLKKSNKRDDSEMDSVDEILYDFSENKQINIDAFVKKIKKRSIENMPCNK
jgi:SNF2 family DNA or RNA helicase